MRLLCIAALTAALAAASTVDVSITASWKDTPLLAEASEAVGAMRPELFWSFVDLAKPIPDDIRKRLIAEGESPADCNATSPQIEQYSKALSIIPGILFSAAQQKLARAELAARAFSPKVEAHNTAAIVALNGSVNRENPDCVQDAFVEVGEKRTVCSVKDLEDALRLMSDCPAASSSRFADEHVFEIPANTAVTTACRPHITLYGVLGTARTTAFVQAIRAAVKAGRVTAWYRHYVAPSPHLAQPLGVVGYGVTLDVKNMEYKAVDEKSTAEDTVPNVDGINMKLLLSRFPTLQANLTRFAKKAATAVTADLDLKVWEVQKLGYQAAHVILSDPNPMRAFVDLTENFPARVGRISMLESTPEFEATSQAVEYIQNSFGEGQTTLWLDGRPLDAAKHDLFALLGAIRDEEALSNGILQGLTGKTNSMQPHDQALRAVQTCPLQGPRDGEKPRLIIPESDVSWVNNIEEDEMYSNLETRVMSILQPGYYGQPRFARRNLFNVIYIIDPTNRDHIEAFASFTRMYQQGAAMRFGVMFKFPPVEAGERSESLPIMVATVLEHVTKKNPAEASLVLVRALYTLQPGVPLSISAITEAAEAYGARGLSGPSKTAEDFIRVWNARVSKLGLTTFPVAAFNGFVQTEGIEEIVFRRFGQEFARVKQLVASKKINDGTRDVYGAVHGEDSVHRYQPAIFDSILFGSWEALNKQAALASGTWLHAHDHSLEVCDLSHVLTFNSTTVNQLKSVGLVLNFLKTCKSGACAKSRLSLWPCDSSRLANVITAVLHASQALSEKKRIGFVHGFFEKIIPLVEADPSLIDHDNIVPVAEKVLKGLGPTYAAVLDWNADFALSQTNAGCHALSDGVTNETLLHTNGRVTLLDSTFTLDDLAVLERIERAQRGAPMAACVQPLDFAEITEGNVAADDLNSEFYATKVAILGSVMATDLNIKGGRAYGRMPVKGAHGFSVNGSRHELVGIVDPVSRSAQKIAALAQYLTTALNIGVRIHFNPPRRVQKVPIKNYYHFVVESDLHFENGLLVRPRALMKNLPTNVVLTLGIDDPDSWMVFAEVAEDDLDNLKLKSDGVVTAVFGLQSLVITGTCIDLKTMQPPRGLPIVLTDLRGSRDTLVMSNYGYFQLQGQPGFSTLSIQPGRGSDIFTISAVNELPTPTIAINSFAGTHVLLHVQRKPGMEAVDFLEETADKPAEAQESQGFLGSLFGSAPAVKTTWPPARGDRSTKPERPTLNIFSLASGHLYERFLRIMFATVMKSSSDIYGKNTTRIKFWLIENPMSPRFKKLLPKLAEKFGFEYGLVKYKWPHWLIRQTEKQRMIWAYKVLFLDVLFPLDVEKVIFVDADQIIRGDLHDLYNLDLQGRPVAYTPFCRAAARDETKGFRFWDSGYWKDHLQGKPYHISAIYVVDLIRLRRIAAGDRYRMIYDGLAQDPNSLANLDQDLPNYAQHQIPIFSLPEEWLWCETWCSDDSKKSAKTIDLCNNPLTKTPKLENAKRIIPEWEALDNELTEFERSVL